MTASSVATLVRALNDAGVRYLIAGGLAVAAHGHLRFTADVMDVAPGVPATFVGRQDLLAMKRRAGRPQDLADIDALESVDREGADGE